MLKKTRNPCVFPQLGSQEGINAAAKNYMIIGDHLQVGKL